MLTTFFTKNFNKNFDFNFWTPCDRNLCGFTCVNATLFDANVWVMTALVVHLICCVSLFCFFFSLTTDHIVHVSPWDVHRSYFCSGWLPASLALLLPLFAMAAGACRLNGCCVLYALRLRCRVVSSACLADKSLTNVSHELRWLCVSKSFFCLLWKLLVFLLTDCFCFS